MDCPDVMDFEASGFGVESYPIEVGFCLSTHERFCVLIKPAPKWTHWDKSAEAVHGISRKLLQDKGREASLVCEELNRRLSGRTLYSDAWVADKVWLNRLFEAGRMQPKFHLCAIENIQTECQYGVWDRVRDRLLKESTFARHRASSDAEFIQRLFMQSRDICEQIDDSST